MRRLTSNLDSSALMHRALRNSTFFGEWPESSLERVVEIAHLNSHDRGAQVQTLVKQWREMVVVVSGRVEVSRTNAKGEKFVISLLCPGDCAGLVRLLPDFLAPYDYYAREDALVAHIPCDPLIKLLDSEPILWRFVALYAVRKQRNSIASIQHRVLNDLSSDLASLLVKLVNSSNAAVASGARPDLHLSQNDLGTMLGVSRQTVNKELGKLSDKGIVAIDYGRITVLDLRSLQALAELDTNQ